MKTLIVRFGRVSLVALGMVWWTGCEEEKANADVVPIFQKESAAVVAAPANFPSSPSPVEVEAPAPPVSVAPVPPAVPVENAPLDTVEGNTNLPPARMVQGAMVPSHLKISPALAEIIKLVQAGVSEEVLLAFASGSDQLFGLGADEIVYLNDLGVSTPVITAILQHDSSRGSAVAQKEAATPSFLLPPGAALNTPAPNIYPSSPTPSTPVAGASDTVAPPPPADVPATVPSVSYFYSSLTPYGNWVQVEGYGLCWQPTVAVVNANWRPYGDNGRWMWTDHGWYWYSDYSWGWAPFHYGRWRSYPRLGWMWVPDTMWGPSWVSWRYTSAYCGWAPLPPEARCVSGVGFFYRDRRVGIGFDFGLSASLYAFLPVGRFCDRSPRHYFVPHTEVHGIYRESTVINNYVVRNHNTIINEGGGRERIAAGMRGEVPRARVREAAFANGPAVRPERLVSEGSSVVVVRPKLPREPLVRPTHFPNRTRTDLGNAHLSAPTITPAGPRPPQAGSSPAAAASPVQDRPAPGMRPGFGRTAEFSNGRRFAEPANGTGGQGSRVFPNRPAASASSPLPSPAVASAGQGGASANRNEESLRSGGRRPWPQTGTTVGNESRFSSRPAGQPSPTGTVPAQPAQANRVVQGVAEQGSAANVARPFAPMSPGNGDGRGPRSSAGISLARPGAGMAPSEPSSGFRAPAGRPSAPAPQVSQPSPQARTPVAVPSVSPRFNAPANPVTQAPRVERPVFRPQPAAVPMARPQVATPPPVSAPRFAAPPAVSSQPASPPSAAPAAPGQRKRDQR